MNTQTGAASARGGAFGWIAAPFLSALLFLSIFFVPFLGGLLNPFAPLPIIYYIFTHGQNAAMVAVLAAAGCIAAVAGLKGGMFYLLSYGLAGMAMAWTIRTRASLTRAVAIPSAVAMGATALFFALSAGTSMAAMYENTLGRVRTLVTESITAYEKAGMPAEQLAILKENAEPIALWAVRIFPATTAVLYLGLFLTNYVTYAALQRRWSFLPPAAPIEGTRWSPPERTVFAFIAGGLLLLAPGDAAMVGGTNLLIITGAVYFITGLCIVQFWFEKARFPRFLSWVVYILVLVQPFMIAGMAVLGLFDLWFDFRKIRRKEGEKEESNGTDT